MNTSRPGLPLELWGGVECTINRVRDAYHDQLRRSGHLTRVSDIDRFAALGLKALRVPLMWERSCASGVEQEPSFEWVEPLLARVHELELRPIATLVHHGSGPPGTHLLDPAFPEALARYARRVAERFPWVCDYTPINEPLTTARFSALYGHWYPHATATRSFLRALLHECRATVLAMRAIRAVVPGARLVQTEDIATVRSTPLLSYQAQYENDRRFLSFDLLCGRVDASHPLHDHLREHGVRDEDLAFFLESPCPPDVLGINYYFTSDRYLDENLSSYPAWSHGGNGKHSYADIDAGHVPGIGLVGHAQVLRTVWNRYRLPMAITEVHAGCTREEQLRWLEEAYHAAIVLRAEGVDLRALTAWALLGSYDWNCLVTREAGVYETGVFDLRGKEPRPTALGTMIQGLASGRGFDHPVLASPGWWHRRSGVTRSAVQRTGAPRPILITGARGHLARAFAQACEERGLACELLTREQLDITNVQEVRDALAGFRPWAVINAAGLSGPADAQRDPAHCQRVNTQGPVLLAELCKAAGIRLLTFSSDHVFSGDQRRPYLETDSVAPLSVYGRSQVEAEQRILSLWHQVFIVRTSTLFGRWNERDALTALLQRLVAGERVRLSPQATFSPTYTPHLVDACLDLLIDGAHELWHLSSGSQETWVSLLQRLARSVALPAELIEPDEVAAEAAPRPSYRVLGSARGCFMPSIEVAVEQYARGRPAALSA